MMPRQLPSPPPPPSAHLNSPLTSTRRPPSPPPHPSPNYPASNGRTIINYTDYYSNNLFPKQNHHGIASATSGTATVAAAGVVYVRPEEIGIVILVLLGKTTMILLLLLLLSTFSNALFFVTELRRKNGAPISSHHTA
jgi:hypothetical protein